MNRIYQKKWVFTLILLACLPVSGQRLLTLEQAIEEAKIKSPSIIQARLDLVRSRENLNAQRASLKSNFALNLIPLRYKHGNSYDNTNKWVTSESTSSSGNFSVTQPILLTDGTIQLINNFGWYNQSSSFDFPQSTIIKDKYFSNDLSLRLEQPIFTYNRRKLDLRKLELALENSRLRYALRELTIEKEVSQAFYRVYQAQISLNIAREEYANRQKSHDIIKNKVEAGLSAREELFQAELDLLSSKSTVQNNEVDLENLKDSFKQLLGISLTEEMMVIAEVSVVPVNVDLPKALELGLASRMELRQRQIEIEQGQFDLITTNGLNEFKGDIGVTVGLFGKNEELKTIYSKPTDNQDISVSLKVPLWDWGEKKARMNAARASLQSSEYYLEDEKISIALNIRQLYRSLNNQLIQIEIARKNEENAKLTYDINLEKYKNGDLTSMDLNLFQNQLTQKKKGYTDALIQYKLELLNLKIQTLYNFETNTAVVPNLTESNTRR